MACQAPSGESSHPLQDCMCCSKHFCEDDFVTVVLPEFGPTKPKLKPEAVPTKICFTPMPKHQQTSEARTVRTEHQDIPVIEGLTTSVLSGPSAPISSDAVILVLMFSLQGLLSKILESSVFK